MKKVLAFLATFVILMILNFGAAFLFHANIIDLTFPVGILGILMTAPNNRMTDFSNSQTYMEVEGKRGAKFGRIPIYASVIYTLFAVIITFFYYKSYFI
ncbi:hypothetical protein J7E79_28400 [Bacillus sp. ISL-40]|uniref:hypothetical protein n=1 Tax=unclassified Bacillus (in: firmicutes) TaxID=185979 RepID=UPI001BE86A83|nr:MULTISPECIES: hypothetical protein [unclassified Bacillus (in: firmicutes)]MBT2701205.1 hypothetical protein [Bacillus sp. ISL-40]MBT2744757.1 hypothetical protein [Bacillus sp. ISL-77]